MPVINISKADLLSSEVITPGWYKAEILSFQAKTPKSGGDSTNYVPRFRIIKKGGPEDGRELNHTFNSQAIGRMAPFIAAVMEKPLKEITDALDSGNLEFDSDICVGKKIQIRIKNEEYEKRMTNKVDGFAPYDAVIAF